MFNRQRTLQMFGYDMDPNKRTRRTDKDFESTNKVPKKNLKVIDNCPGCHKERTINLNQSRKNRLCSKCHHNSPEMILAKQNQTKIKSEETKQKMSNNHWSKKGYESPFKGKKHNETTKQTLSHKTANFLASLDPEELVKRYIKASCTVRGTPVEEFDGWATEEAQRLRGSLEYKLFEKKVKERDHCCVVPGCGKRKTNSLTVHHKNGFHWCVDQRVDPDNGVLLCYSHHNEFHAIYGRRNNTAFQYDEWMTHYESKIDKTKKLYIVTGVSGSGKSWVCDQLSDRVYYMSFDKTPKDQHGLKIQEMFDVNDAILFDPTRKATSFYKRYGLLYSAELIVIDETLSVIKERLVGRGGKLNPRLEKYVSNMRGMAKQATFSGTSQEVLEYLKSKV